MTLLAVAAFGLVGIFARLVIAQVMAPPPESLAFPVATLGINVVGSLVGGIVYAYAVERGFASDALRLGVMVGLLGGFTTFSAFSIETLAMLEARRIFSAVAYVTASPLLGVVAAALGAFLFRALAR